MRWLDLFGYFDMTIRYVPKKSNVVAGVLSHRLDLGAVIGLVKSGLLTQIC